MTNFERDAPSKLLDYLPEIYRDREHTFLSSYLAAFEKILLGRTDGVEIPAGADGRSYRSLEEMIADIATLFDPHSAPAEFLPWLAGWAALSLRADLDEKQQADFLANIIRLYRRRGTKDNLIELLKIFTKTKPQVDEHATPGPKFQERHSFSGTDYFFKVSIMLGDPTREIVARQREIASALIELEKPAHTFYELAINFPSMRIGTYDDIKDPNYRARLGEDTLIGTRPSIGTDGM